MFSSSRQTLCLLFLLGTAVCLQAQTSTPKLATASISGKVTIKGKPAPGVIVVAKDSEGHRTPKPILHRTRTDEAGSYRIRNLPAATYEISSFTPALVSLNDVRSVVVSEDEQIEDVNLALVPGAVIAGRITDSDGKPLIGQYVRITPIFEPTQTRIRPEMLTRLFLENTTDDRGVYRAFGLPPGRYRVSVGPSGAGQRDSRHNFAETFYPSVTDPARATIIEVTEGSEKNGVDITTGRPVQTFRVTGRVVDDETGRPIPNVTYGVEIRMVEEGFSSGSSSVAGETTDANGEFRLENLMPGAYTVFTLATEGSDMPSGSVSFEVKDQNITDLVIKTTKGSSLSGVVVLDGDKKAAAMLRSMRIYAAEENKEAHFAPSSSSAISPDGTFRINGVRSGVVRLVADLTSEDRALSIVSIERNGMPASETIEVKEREQITGLRVVMRALKLTGAIRGQLKVEDGELPPISQLGLLLWPLDENNQPIPSHSIPPPQLDTRGRFVSKGLPAGVYRISVYQTTRTPTGEWTTQDVVVTDDTETEVTVTLKRRPN